MPTFDLKTPNGTTIAIGTHDQTLHRLRGTCFRPTKEPLAGQFLYWLNLFDILQDQWFRPSFLAEVETVVAGFSGDRRQQYFSVKHTEPVGWSATAPRQEFAASELEEFRPSQRSVAMRLRKDSGRMAPLTNEVTFSGDFLKLSDRWSLVIYSVYPGPNIGRLSGPNGSVVDLTASRGVVFFDWSHPGEKLPTVSP